MKPEWKTKLNFIVRQVQKSPNPVLYFIIVTRRERLRGHVDYVVPKKVSQEVNDLSSDRSSVEDYEQDFGLEVDEKATVASLDDEEDDFEDLAEPVDRRRDHGSARNYPRGPGNNLRKREFDEYNDREDSVEKDYEPGKRLKGNNVEIDDDLIQSLQEMEPAEILEYAKNLDQTRREAIMALLSEMKDEESEQSEEPAQSNTVSFRLFPESEDNTIQLQKERERHRRMMAAGTLSNNQGFSDAFRPDQLGQPGRLYNTSTSFLTPPIVRPTASPYRAPAPITQPINTFAQPLPTTNELLASDLTGRKPGSPFRASNIGNTAQFGELTTVREIPRVGGSNSRNATPNKGANNKPQNRNFNNSGNKFNNKPYNQQGGQGGNFQNNRGPNQGQNPRSATSFNNGKNRPHPQQHGGKKFQGHKGGNNNKPFNVRQGNGDVQLNIPGGLPIGGELDLIAGIKLVGDKLEIPKGLLETLQSIPGLTNTLNPQVMTQMAEAMTIQTHTEKKL